MKDNNDRFLLYMKIKAKDLKNLWKENVNKLDDIKIKNVVERFFTKAIDYFVDLGIEKEH